MTPSVFRLRGAVSAAVLAALAALHAAPAAVRPAAIAFSIPAGPAERTLKDFARQTEVEVLFATEAVAGVATAPVSGRFTLREGLDRLLAGTPLLATQDETTGTVRVRRPAAAPPAAPGPAPGADRSVRPPSASADNDGTAITLSPFEVNTDRDRGYLAGNTVSGSRLNARLRDTAAPISPFTPEFLSDFALTNLAEAMSYAANFEADFADTSTFQSPASRTADAANMPFRVRGLAGAFAVDMIESKVPQDFYNIERVDVSSGPNSVLFGLGAAGGTVSLTTKQASVGRRRTTLKATVGSWDFSRTEADHNQVLVPGKLALRVNGLWLDREGWRSYDFEESRRLASAVTFLPWKGTALRVAWDGGNYAKHMDFPWPGGDGVTLWNASGKPIVDGASAANAAALGLVGLQRYAANRWTFYENNRTTYNLLNEVQSNLTGLEARLLGESEMPAAYGFSGPGARLRGSLRNYSAKIEQRIGRDLVIEGAFFSTFNFVEANGWASPGNNIALRGDGNLTTPLPGGGTVPNPFAGRYFFDNNWLLFDNAFRNDVFRAAATHELDLGKWGRHRFAGLLETGETDQIRHAYTEILADQFGVPVSDAAAPENAANQVIRRHYVTPGDFGTYYQSRPDLPLPAFTVGARTLGSRRVALNEAGNRPDRRITDTVMLATQNYWWREKLVTTLGYRLDKVVFKNGSSARIAATDPQVASGAKIANEFVIVPGRFTRTAFEPRTFTAGAVVHATDRFSAFYNQSRNVSAPGLGSRIVPASTPPLFTLPPMSRGESQDYGIMVDVAGDDRFFLRATRFDTAFLGDIPVTNPAFNPFAAGQGIDLALDALARAGRISPAEADAWRVNATQFTGDAVSKGYELEFAANPSRRISLRLVYSYSDRNRENFFPERNPYLGNLRAFLGRVNTAGVVTTGNQTVGQVLEGIDDFIADTSSTQNQPNGSRPHKFNLSGRYKFAAGPLKGLAVGGAVRFQSRNYMQKDERELIGSAPNPRYLREQWGRNFENWDFFSTYALRLPGLRSGVTLQVNVRNAFNQARVQPGRFTADFSAMRRVYLNEPRSLRVSATAEF